MPEEDCKLLLEEMGDLRLGALNSSQLWKHAGRVTGAVASKIVFDNAKARADREKQKQELQQAHEVTDQQLRQNAAPVLE